MRDAGGLVLAQDLDSAQFDGMPRAAFETGVVDQTLPPQDMPRALLEHARHSVAAPAGDRAAPPPRASTPCIAMLEDKFGIDFNHYKPSTVTRRIERRLALAQSPNIDEYLQRLRVERDELDALYRDLLIGVTRFFRDPDAFHLLEERILPDLLTREPRSTPLRFWVAGCATGEEAYSLAILVQELMATTASGRSRSSRPTSTADRSSARRWPYTTRRRSRTCRRSGWRATSHRTAAPTR